MQTNHPKRSQVPPAVNCGQTKAEIEALQFAGGQFEKSDERSQGVHTGLVIQQIPTYTHSAQEVVRIASKGSYQFLKAG
jgi:hypothetical protein